MDITGCFIGTHLRRLADHPDPAVLADASVQHWHAVRAALVPVIGLQGVAALYRRSHFLARREFEWLASDADADPSPANPFDGLRVALMQQPGSRAASAQIAMLQIFNDLLTSLIGSPLTDRLLASVWEIPSAGPATEESEP